MKSRLIPMQQRTSVERGVRLAVVCLLALTSIACTTQPVASRLAKQNPELALLDQLAALARMDVPRIDLDVLSTVAGLDIRPLVLAQQTEAATSDGAVSVTRSIAKPGVAVTAATYRLTSAAPVTDGGRMAVTEQAILVLNPLVACVTEKAIQQHWAQAVQSGRLGAMRYGPGGLWPMDGLHRNKDEQARRGNGPVELIVPVVAPSGPGHTSNFRFTHEYWECARSVTLERRF